MKRQRSLTLAICAFALMLASTIVGARADELVSLDDPAPKPALAKPGAVKPGAPAMKPGAPAAKPGAESLDSLDGSSADFAPAGGDAEVSLDLGGTAKESFNPYTFPRDPRWIFLPVFGLLILTLHLLPVPKRKAKRQVDQAKRFFRGISGEGTGTGLVKNYNEAIPPNHQERPPPESPAARRAEVIAAAKAAKNPAKISGAPGSATGGRPTTLAKSPMSADATVAVSADQVEEAMDSANEALEIIDPNTQPSTRFESFIKKKKGSDG